MGWKRTPPNYRASLLLLILAALFETEITCVPRPNQVQTSRQSPAIPSPYRQRLPIFFANTETTAEDEDDPDYKNDPEIPGPEPPPSIELQETTIDSGKNEPKMVNKKINPENSPSLELDSDPGDPSDPDTNENNLSAEIPSSTRARGLNKRPVISGQKGVNDPEEEMEEGDPRKYIRAHSDFEGRYIPKDSNEGRTDPRGEVKGYPGVANPMYAHPDDYRDEQDEGYSENPAPGKGQDQGQGQGQGSTVASEEAPGSVGDQGTYDATYNSNHNWKVQNPSPPTNIDYSPYPGFSRPCQSYFDCDFQPDEMKQRPLTAANDNSESTWFACDGSYCTCELFGFARDDEASWRVRWSPKSKQCVAEAEGPCGRSDGLHIYCQLGYECYENVCEKVGKKRPQKPGEDCDDDSTTAGGGVNLFSVLFFPKNIVDSILNDTLSVAGGNGGGGKMSNNYNTY